MNEKMKTFNSIGIDNKLDWNRISHLMWIGLLAGVMVLVGDMILGWGVSDPTLNGIARKLSAYNILSDSRIFWSAILGFIGIPLEGICYFSIYRLIAPYSEKYAHMYRTGILGYIAFGGCGVHVPCLATVFFYKYMMQANPDRALELTTKYGYFFLIPGTAALLIFFVIHSIAHICAFIKGLTPYPKWCWIFCLPVGMGITAILNLFGNHAFINAITAGWISVGNIWMFLGLLIMKKSVKRKL